MSNKKSVPSILLPIVNSSFLFLSSMWKSHARIFHELFTRIEYLSLRSFLSLTELRLFFWIFWKVLKKFYILEKFSSFHVRLKWCSTFTSLDLLYVNRSECSVGTIRATWEAYQSTEAFNSSLMKKSSILFLKKFQKSGCIFSFCIKTISWI